VSVTTDIPFPETLEALTEQLGMLRDGRKPAVLVPHWSPAWQAPEGVDLIPTPAGTVAVLHGVLAADDVQAAVREDRLGLLLGYGVARKPDRPTSCLVLTDSQGAEILAVLVDRDNAAAVLVALEQMRRPEQKIVARAPLDVIQARLAWWTQFFAEPQTGG
jgi:hypothetical protein